MNNIISYLKSRLTKLQSDPKVWQHHYNMQKLRQRIQDSE